MKTIVTVLIALLGTGILAEGMTPEKLMELKRISEFRISPNGNTLLMTISQPNIKENTTESQVYTVSIKGGTPRQLTYEGNNYNGVWSGDGKKIAFISDRTEQPQAFILDLEKGGEAKQVTFMENGIGVLSWSPDGKHLAFVSDVKLGQTLEEKYPKLNKAKALIYDDLPIRHWDHWLDEKYRHLFVMPADGGEPLDLMKNEKFDAPLKPFGGYSEITWSPKGTEIAYVSKKVKDYESSTNSSIYIAPAYGGTSKEITQAYPGFDLDPLYSPNGNYIAFLSMEREGYEADRLRIMIYTKSSGRTEELTVGFDHSVKNPVWAPNGSKIYFAAGNNDGTNQIYALDVKSKKTEVLTTGNFNFGDKGIQITPDGKTLIFNKRSYNRPTEIFAMDIATKKISLVTDINGAAFKDVSQAKVEARWITSTDSARVHCWVVYPPNFNPNNKYPMITYCQGGPQQEVSQYWSYGWNFLTMAHKGYIILAPNRRGCPGFGQDWVDAIRRDYGGQPMLDIISATKELAKEPYIDNNRIAAIGGSAGGYAVFWLAGSHNGLFKSFISHCGMFNMTSKYGSTEELWFPNWDNGGPYWEPQNKPFYEEHSPHTYVEKWNTPMLIITGELDYRVPYTQSLEAFTAAQARGVPSRLLHFPQENHWVLHPQEQILWYEEFFRFLDIYMN